MDQKEEYRKWGETAHYWNLFRTTVEQIYGPITEALLDRSEISSKHTVLDIGGGTGEPSLTILTRTGASIVFTDPTNQMASFARDEAQRRELQGILFCVCSGDSLPFPDRSFDRVVARLSMMFIPDSLQAAREMLRVTKPGGIITLAVWNDMGKNVMHSVPTNALRPYIPAEPQPPDAPGAFRFAEPGKLYAVFKAAGARQIEETVVDFDITAMQSIDEFWDIRSQMSESLRDKLGKLSPGKKEQAIAAAKEAVRKYYVDGRMCFPASVRFIIAMP